jgi:hypothetical protein
MEKEVFTMTYGTESVVWYRENYDANSQPRGTFTVGYMPKVSNKLGAALYGEDKAKSAACNESWWIVPGTEREDYEFNPNS